MAALRVTTGPSGGPLFLSFNQDARHGETAFQCWRCSRCLRGGLLLAVAGLQPCFAAEGLPPAASALSCSCVSIADFAGIRIWSMSASPTCVLDLPLGGIR